MCHHDQYGESTSVGVSGSGRFVWRSHHPALRRAFAMVLLTPLCVLAAVHAQVPGGAMIDVGRGVLCWSQDSNVVCRTEWGAVRRFSVGTRVSHLDVVGTRVCVGQSSISEPNRCWTVSPEPPREIDGDTAVCEAIQSGREVRCIQGGVSRVRRTAATIDRVFASSEYSGCAWSRRHVECWGFAPTSRLEGGVGIEQSEHWHANFESEIVHVDVGTAGACVLDRSGDVWCLGLSPSLTPDRGKLYVGPTRLLTGVVAMGSSFGRTGLQVCVTRSEVESPVCYGFVRGRGERHTTL